MIRTIAKVSAWALLVIVVMILLGVQGPIPSKAREGTVDTFPEDPPTIMTKSLVGAIFYASEETDDIVLCVNKDCELVLPDGTPVSEAEGYTWDDVRIENKSGKTVVIFFPRETFGRASVRLRPGESTVVNIRSGSSGDIEIEVICIDEEVKDTEKGTFFFTTVDTIREPPPTGP